MILTLSDKDPACQIGRRAVGSLKRWSRLEFTHHPFANYEFLNLPGEGHRKFLYESYIVRNFVMRNLPVTEFTNVVLGQLGAVAGLYPCGSLAPRAFVSASPGLEHYVVGAGEGVCQLNPHVDEEAISSPSIPGGVSR